MKPPHERCATDRNISVFLKDQGRAKGPAVWGGAARPVTQAADASRGGGEAGVGRKAQQVGNGRAISPIVQHGPLKKMKGSQGSSNGGCSSLAWTRSQAAA